MKPDSGEKENNVMVGPQANSTLPAPEPYALLMDDRCHAVTLMGKDYWAIPRDIYNLLSASLERAQQERGRYKEGLERIWRASDLVMEHRATDRGTLQSVAEKYLAPAVQLATVTHYDLQQITVLCEDGIERRGTITDMPFQGNEHQSCTLEVGTELHAVSMAEVIRVVGKDPRRF